MKTCKVCKKNISKRAKFCPSCGDQGSAAWEGLKKFLLYFVAIPVIVVVVVLIAYAPDQASTPPAKASAGLPKKAPPPEYKFVQNPPASIAGLDGVELQYREDVARMIDRMRAEISTCNQSMPEGLVTWMNRDIKTANPEFSAWCGEGRERERYFFRWMDIVNGAAPYKKESLSYGKAVELCRLKAFRQVNFPETAHLKKIRHHDAKDGTGRITAELHAKNAFGVPVSADVTCDFNETSLTDFRVN